MNLFCDKKIAVFVQIPVITVQNPLFLVQNTIIAGGGNFRSTKTPFLNPSPYIPWVTVP